MPLNRPLRRFRSFGPARRARAVMVAVAAVLASACAGRAPRTAIRPEAPTDFVVHGPADLPAGTFVRYHVRGHWLGVRTGRVAEATADTLWLRDRDMLWRRTRRAVPVARLRDLAFTRTDYPKEDKVGVAMLAGGIVSWMLAASLPPPDVVEAEAVEGVLYLYSVAVGSLVTGIAFALVLPGDTYEPVPLPGTTR